MPAKSHRDNTLPYSQFIISKTEVGTDLVHKLYAIKQYKQQHWAATVHRYTTSDGAAVMVVTGYPRTPPLRLAKHKTSKNN